MVVKISHPPAKEIIRKSVRKLIKSKKNNRTKVIFDLLSVDLRIFPAVYLNRNIDLKEDRAEMKFFNKLWGKYWRVGNLKLCTSGKTFQFIKKIRISEMEESFSLKITMEKTDCLICHCLTLF